MKKLTALMLVLLAAAGCGSGSGEKVPARPESPVCAQIYGGAKTAELPPGTFPDLFFSISRDRIWSCVLPGDGQMSFDFMRDGTFSGRWTGNPSVFRPLLLLHPGTEAVRGDSFSENDYSVRAWEACRVGTRPPGFGGKWVWSQSRGTCLLFDIFPFGYVCGAVLAPDPAEEGGGTEVPDIPVGNSSRAYTADGKTGPGGFPKCRLFPGKRP